MGIKITPGKEELNSRLQDSQNIEHINVPVQPYTDVLKQKCIGCYNTAELKEVGHQHMEVLVRSTQGYTSTPLHINVIVKHYIFLLLKC